MILLLYTGLYLGVTLMLHGVAAIRPGSQQLESCHYNGFMLQSSHKKERPMPPEIQSLKDKYVCGKDNEKATQDGCYFDKAKYYSDVKDGTLNHDSRHPDQILICGHAPAWVQELCYFLDGGRQFACGVRGKPLYNIRATISEQTVDLGTLDLSELYLNPKKFSAPEQDDRDKSGGGKLFKSRTYTQGCHGESDEKHHVAEYSLTGVWGALNDKDENNPDPVIYDEETTGKWLMNALKETIDALVKTGEYSYNVALGCPDQQPIRFKRRAYSTKRSAPGNVCASEWFDCEALIEEGCGWVRFGDGKSAHPSCQEYVGNKYCSPEQTPCKNATVGYHLPEEISVHIYDKDELQSSYASVKFEGKGVKVECSRFERIMSFLPGFQTEFPVFLLGNLIGLKCLLHATAKDPETTHITLQETGIVAPHTLAGTSVYAAPPPPPLP
ncbi:hypothetical protein BCR37DRAFT_392396 [Protomyces lactucae-debilis]|uniref:Uncharacterized protein n=1 Tax=Protomyces lactucae-debilis TaxID=2754530 RepID=A0A1Y2FJS0_PROLT|nr:uncharacterized protein BCR37DRAFT_392396 [Protomyces lactucae-debilis]ORY83035.1 hypothetical protein BCR37DRAFT_392396 [Protomyces lactucae-debilis]